LYNIIQLTHASDNIEPPVGLFTAQARPTWARARGKLLAIDPINKETLEKIQSALIVVVLDSASQCNYDEVTINEEILTR
jgi:carnitine O-acetyltransferase